MIFIYSLGSGTVLSALWVSLPVNKAKVRIFVSHVDLIKCLSSLLIYYKDHYWNHMFKDTTITSLHTHAHPFNGSFFGTSWVTRYQKRKTNLDFTEAIDTEWQWHQLGYMQVCISFQTDNHASTPLLSFYRPDTLPATQPTASKHWRQQQLHH